MICSRRPFSTQAPAHAFQALSSGPGKKFPKSAQPKQWNLTQHGSQLKLATVDDLYSPISSLALVVQAGPRYQQGQEEVGVAQWLKTQGFKSTNGRSTIRLTREADILGQQLTAVLTREQLILNVDFQRKDLADTVELLADIVDGFTRRDQAPLGIYTREFVRKSHEWRESVGQLQEESALASAGNPLTVLLDRLHHVAYRQGLANPLFPQVASVNPETALKFAERRFTAGNISLVGYGVHHVDLSAAAEEFFGDISIPAAAAGGSASAHKYHGGCDSHDLAARGQGVHYAVAFPGASLAHQDYFSALVLRQLMGGNTKISRAVKYSSTAGGLPLLSNVKGAGVEAFSASYSDAGLFGVIVSGDDVNNVRQAVKSSVAALKNAASGQVSENAVKSAIASAQFALASDYETSSRLHKIQGLAGQVAVSKKLHNVSELNQQLAQVDVAKVQAFAAKIVKHKPSLASTGDAFGLHSDELL